MDIGETGKQNSNNDEDLGDFLEPIPVENPIRDPYKEDHLPWHICPDFLNPQIEELNKWLKKSEHTIDDIESLQWFDVGIDNDVGPDNIVNAWSSAKYWLKTCAPELKDDVENIFRALAKKSCEAYRKLHKTEEEWQDVLISQFGNYVEQCSRDLSYISRLLQDRPVMNEQHSEGKAVAQSPESMNLEGKQRNSGLTEELTYLFRDDGAVYRVRFEGEEGTMKKTRGARYIYELLQYPNKPFRSYDLHLLDRQEDPKVTKKRRLGAASADEQCEMDIDGGGPLHDTGKADQDENQEALRKYHLRIKEIKIELDQAPKELNSHDYERLEKEKDAIIAEVKRLTSLYGKARLLDPQNEKARQTVSKRITEAIKSCRENRKLSKFADHLDKCIDLGANNVYRSSSPPLDWKF
jgi:hypothetical protein